MIDFSDKNYRNILAQMLQRIPDTYDKRDTSPIPTALGPAAWSFEGFFLSLDQVQRQAFIQTAVGDALDKLAVIAGLSRYPASPAVRIGIFNMPVPVGARFSTANGAESINFAITAPTETANQYQLTAETPGEIGNEYTGAILPITAIPGLTLAQLAGIVIPGDDAETDDQLRDRILTALTQRPFGGNIASYREYVMEIDGVGAVQIYPTWNGGGTVKCSILGADSLPASAQLTENVQNALDPPPNQGLGLGMAPIGAKVTVVAPTALAVNVTAALTLSPGYSIGQVQQPIEDALSAYLLKVRQEWSDNTSATSVAYTANVYLARVIAAMIGVGGVVNATSVQLNGGTEDLILTQTGAIQQVPVFGTVTLNE